MTQDFFKFATEREEIEASHSLADSFFNATDGKPMVLPEHLYKRLEESSRRLGLPWPIAGAICEQRIPTR